QKRQQGTDHLKTMINGSLMFALFTLSCIGGLILIWRRHNPAWRRKAARDAGASAVAFYQEMLKKLESLGHKRELHQTPSEFAAQLAMPPVTEITRFYERTRFSNEMLSEDELLRISLLLRELSNGSRRARAVRFTKKV